MHIPNVTSYKYYFIHTLSLRDLLEQIVVDEKTYTRRHLEYMLYIRRSLPKLQSTYGGIK